MALSTTLTVKEADAPFFCASCAVQATVVTPSGKSAPGPGEHATSTGPETRSTAAGGTYVTREPLRPSASETTAAGTALNAGGVVSRTVTMNVAFALFPRESVAVHDTVVVPTGNVLPDDGEQVGSMAPSTMSDADAENVTGAPFGPVASVTMSPVTVTLGGVVSRTVTVNVLGALVLPESSVAVQLTVVVAIAKVLPDGGPHVTVGDGSTMSERGRREGDDRAARAGRLGGDVARHVHGRRCRVLHRDGERTRGRLPESSVAVQLTFVVPTGNTLPEGGEHETVSSCRRDRSRRPRTSRPRRRGRSRAS